MDNAVFFDFLSKLEKLKCNTRHSFTSSGRPESVAEHCWRLSIMVLLLKDDFPNLDIDKALKMCIIHDFGEAITGDIPAFEKTISDEITEEAAIDTLLSDLPPSIRKEFSDLFAEMEAQVSEEAKLTRALDKLEAVIQHNEAPLSTWIELEHTLNLTYGTQECDVFEKTQSLRKDAKSISLRKLQKEK